MQIFSEDPYTNKVDIPSDPDIMHLTIREFAHNLDCCAQPPDGNCTA